jgi:hypothetical protein
MQRCDFLKWVVVDALLNHRQSEEIRRKLMECSICETVVLYRIGAAKAWPVTPFARRVSSKRCQKSYHRDNWFVVAKY